jgi:hypothetical protein
MREKLVMGFNAQAEGLKKRAEQNWLCEEYTWTL